MEMTEFVINAQSTYIVYGKLGCLVKKKIKVEAESHPLSQNKCEVSQRSPCKGGKAR